MKPGLVVPAVGATTAAVISGPVLSTITLNEPLALLAALSMAVSDHPLAPAASTAVAVTEALR